MRSVCIHGHFYQPPRENPWLEEVERQDSAYPFHDWNERIAYECYAPNTASRILGRDWKIIDIVNNYSLMSFNFGPSLLSWMQRKAPETYQAILEADRAGRERFSGHGTALAQVYNHMIMPLASSRDKRTQVIWGIRDFEHRFGRRPEGMWLAETAVDLETLEIMASCGIDFTILAPNQARQIRRLGESEWRDVSGGRIDPKRPYLCRLPSGSAINLFFYDGPISRDVAFGDLLDNGQGFAGRLLGAFTGNGDEDQLVHIATDGESYGHHRRFGDMALAFCLRALESNGSVQLTVYGEYLENHPASWEVEIFENSSWSCMHGIERWRSDCGCNSGGHPGWNQRWRRPLREAMDWLRDRLVELYEKEGPAYFRDPWRARDDYIRVILNRSDRALESFFATHGREGWHKEKSRAALKLLEIQRNAMLMFTSCGWFFDEISGLETVQIVQYAARAIQLARDAAGLDLEAEYRDRLARASSNIPGYKDGAWIYDNFVKPAVVDLHRVGAHYAVTSLFEEYPEKKRIYEYQIKSEQYDRREAGKQKCAVGRILVTSLVTREAVLLDFASLYLGNHNLVAAVRNHDGADESSLAGIMEAFQGNNIPEVIRGIDRNFEKHNYTLWHLFRDEQRQVLDHVIHGTREELEATFRHLYRHHYPVIQVLKKAEVPLPREMAALEEFVLNADFRATLESARINTKKLQNLVDELKGRPQQIDRQLVEFVVRRRVEKMMEEIIAAPDDLSGIRRLSRVLKTIEQLPVRIDFWKAQNLFFRLAQAQVRLRRARGKAGDEEAGRWLRTFAKLGEQLRVGLPEGT